MVTYRKDETQRPEGWNTGAPPHVGWWAVHASWGKLGDFHAWWDGKMWSNQTCSKDEDCRYATNNLSAHEAGVYGDWSKWSWAWNEDARVARVNPETGEVTGSGPCPYETSGQAWPFGDVKKKAADVSKMKKKPAGNRKVIRYVVAETVGLYTSHIDPTAILGVYSDSRVAEKIAKKMRESARFSARVFKTKRFRTPEA